MINWQNRQHRFIIIISGALLLFALVSWLFFSLLNKPKEELKQLGTKQPENAQKFYPVNEGITKWRQKEAARLEKAKHDKALYQEILASKESSRCQEMQNLDGASICLLSLATDLRDGKICDQISNEEFKTACQDNFKIKK